MELTVTFRVFLHHFQCVFTDPTFLRFVAC